MFTAKMIFVISCVSFFSRSECKAQSIEFEEWYCALQPTTSSNADSQGWVKIRARLQFGKLAALTPGCGVPIVKVDPAVGQFFLETSIGASDRKRETTSWSTDDLRLLLQHLVEIASVPSKSSIEVVIEAKLSVPLCGNNAKACYVTEVGEHTWKGVIRLLEVRSVLLQKLAR